VVEVQDRDTVSLEPLTQFVLAQRGDRQGDACCLRVLLRREVRIHRRGQPPYFGSRILLMRVVGDAARKGDSRQER
jgi:hypothetical protein